MKSSFQDVNRAFKKFPGIGPKLAERLSFYTIEMKYEELQNFCNTLLNFKNKMKICSTCGLMSTQNPCKICSSPSRNQSSICIVKNIQDAFFLEKSKSFKGLYHVMTQINDLGSKIIEDELELEPLIKRLKNVKEIIFALETSLESEIAIKEIKKKLSNFSLIFTRLATGIPTGVSLEYLDEDTIKNAISYRTTL